MNLKEITIEITQRCPNYCVHCSSLSSSTKSSFLPVNVIKNIVDDVVELGCQIICLSGGEPFMYHDLLQIVNHIKGKGMKCHIYTSGICMIGDNAVSVPARMVEELHGKVDRYIVNVEAADEVTYNAVMGTAFNGFEKMREFVRNVVSMGDTVEAHFVPMRPNYLQIPAVVEMCSALGISKISFLRLVKQGRCMSSADSLLMNEEEMTCTKRMIDECRKQNKIGIRVGIPFQECAKRTNCLTGTAKMVVRYDGNVYPCEAFKNDQPDNKEHTPADNVRTQRIVDIYQKSEYLNEIRGWLESFQQVATCETCFAQYLTEL